MHFIRKLVSKFAAGLRLFTLFFATCGLIGSARAHVPSKSYLVLTVGSNQIKGEWDIPLVDLQFALPLDSDHNGFVTWDELNAGYSKVLGYAFAHLKITVDGQPVICHAGNKEPVVDDFTDGTYVKIPFTLDDLPNPKVLQLEYDLFFDFNSLHRGLLRLEAGGRTQTAVFTPEATTQRLETSAPHPGRQFLVFLREGVFHIWTGYDHILFLLALLLPSVLRREAGRWRGVDNLRPAFINVFKIVTAFTLAHSLTLSLATLQIVKLPTRLTESAIAASVVLAAANNLHPLIRERGWIVAFIFGLIHGFGFANALSDLGLVHGTLLLTLVGFNLGVEAGQLAIVAVFLPLAFGLRNSWFYQKVPLLAGSAFIMLVASVWLAERVFNFKLLPF
jgi:hypothetical protein